MHHITVIGSTGIGVDGVQGPQLQDIFGIDRIRIAHPAFDGGGEQGAGPSLQRRAGSRWRNRGGSTVGLVQAAVPAHPLFLVPIMLVPAGLKHSVEAEQPAGRHGGRAIHPQRAGHHQLGGAEGLGEIMGRQADAAFR